MKMFRMFVKSAILFGAVLSLLTFGSGVLDVRAEGPGAGLGIESGPGGRGAGREDAMGMRREKFKERMREMRDGEGPRGEMRGDGREGPGEGMGRNRQVGRFIDFISKFTDSVKDPHQAVSLASLNIKEEYRKKGNPLGAVKELEGYLDSASEQSMRNVLLFSIRQIYEDAGEHDKALEVTRKVLKENVSKK